MYEQEARKWKIIANKIAPIEDVQVKGPSSGGGRNQNNAQFTISSRWTYGSELDDQEEENYASDE